MALVQCPDCGNDVSDKAPACPACGHPMAAATVELTGKEYKAMMLLGGVAIPIGLVSVYLGAPQFGTVTVILGLIVYFSARIGQWWHHG